jgi:hypothetical protein
LNVLPYACGTPLDAVRVPLALLALLALPVAAAAPLLVAVVPDLPSPGSRDEGFAIGCPEACVLDGWRVTDDEGTWTAPPGTTLSAGGVLWATGDAAAWAAHGGPDALVWDDRRLALSNGGETLRLLEPQGSEVDRFTWGPGGDVTTLSRGLEYRRMPQGPAWQDTDSAVDWVTPRAHRIGESAIAARTFTVQEITFFATPDSSYDVLLALIEGARERLHLHVYELAHAYLAQALIDAARRGVDVQVLVDRSPAGGAEPGRAKALGALVAAGADVFTASGRYSHYHMKLLVADDDVVVSSENWVANGAPVTASHGNRGWGVVLHDGAAADWFAAWMADDRAAWDSTPWTATSDPPLLRPDDRGSYQGVPAQRVVGPFSVAPIISPEHTAYAADPVAAAIAGAAVRVWTQQLTLRTVEDNPLGWSAPDRYVSALMGRAAAGVDVRIWQEERTHRDHAWQRPQLQLWRHPDLGWLHNKAWIVDDAVIVGSMNGNHASRSANREVDVLIEGPGAADAFSALFLADELAHAETRGVRIPWAPLPILFGLLWVAVAGRRP